MRQPSQRWRRGKRRPFWTIINGKWFRFLTRSDAIAADGAFDVDFKIVQHEAALECVKVFANKSQVRCDTFVLSQQLMPYG